MIKRWTAIALLTTSALTVTGCLGSGGDPARSPTPSHAATTQAPANALLANLLTRHDVGKAFALDMSGTGLPSRIVGCAAATSWVTAAHPAKGTATISYGWAKSHNPALTETLFPAMAYRAAERAIRTCESARFTIGGKMVKLVAIGMRLATSPALVFTGALKGKPVAIYLAVAKPGSGLAFVYVEQGREAASGSQQVDSIFTRAVARARHAR